MYEDEAQDADIIEMTDDEGNTILLQVVDYFFYNGDEYVILTDSIDEDEDCGCSCEGCEHDCHHDDAESAEADEDDMDEAEEITCYIMKVITSTGDDGEDMEEFVPVEDEALEAKLIEVATTKLNEDDSEDEE